MSQYAFNPNARVRRYFVVELRPVDVPKFLQDNKDNHVREVSEEEHLKGKKVNR